MPGHPVTAAVLRDTLKGTVRWVSRQTTHGFVSLLFTNDPVSLGCVIMPVESEEQVK